MSRKWLDWGLALLMGTHHLLGIVPGNHCREPAAAILQTFRLVFVAVAVVTLSLELIMLANRMFLLEDEKVLIGNQISV